MEKKNSNKNNWTFKKTAILIGTLCSVPFYVKKSGLIVPKVEREGQLKYLIEQMKIYGEKNELFEGIVNCIQQYNFGFTKISCWISFTILTALTIAALVLAFWIISKLRKINAKETLTTIADGTKKASDAMKKASDTVINHVDKASKIIRSELIPEEPDRPRYIGVSVQENGVTYFTGVKITKKEEYKTRFTLYSPSGSKELRIPVKFVFSKGNVYLTQNTGSVRYVVTEVEQTVNMNNNTFTIVEM